MQRIKHAIPAIVLILAGVLVGFAIDRDNVTSLTTAAYASPFPQESDPAKVTVAEANLATPEGSAEENSGTIAVHHYFKKKPHQHHTKWGYRGEIGPVRWGQLSPQYRLASEGKKQSPIDISTDRIRPTVLPKLRFEYKQEERIALVNNGHAIQHNDTPGSFLHVGDRVFALEQFHFHVPSEHTIDGRHADMEIHFVHKSTAGEVAVVAVLVNRDAEKSIRTPLFQELPTRENEVAEADNLTASPADLLPIDMSYHTYTGSLTTPPCYEGVRWFVMRSPVQIHHAALAEHIKAIGGNNRPVQPLNGREIQGSKD